MSWRWFAVCALAACNRTQTTPKSNPPCKCDSPVCPMVCGLAGQPDGTHLEAYIDAKTGAGIGEFEVDHDYVDGVRLDADLVTGKLTATGAGCP